MKYLPTLNRLLLIVLAIINKFAPPLFTENDFYNDIVEKILSRAEKINELEKEIQLFGKQTIWQEVDETSSRNCPRLTLEELEMITLGTYQLNMGKLYNSQHCYYGIHTIYIIHKSRLCNWLWLSMQGQ